MEESLSRPSGRRPEVLAPAGGPEVLSAALKAGADAVYFGLKKLNARRGAVNFLPEALPETVAQIHASGAKAYLTLNIQLSQRELGLAFRTLQCAQDAGIDAVLITDAALLAAMPFFPGLDFHFSTQAGVSSSAGVLAGKALGLTRVVLARELSRDEIAACCACGVEIETFVQGAHCFSCSGRCLLSSWGGGRSGNRGACTSPCRVKWQNAKGDCGTPLSMHDMSLLGDLGDLSALGVASLKIEGRLKSARWVSDAVSLYRQALDGSESLAALTELAQHLGNYTGRKLSDGFFHGQREGLTGDSGRVASSVGGGSCDSGCGSEDDEVDAPPHLVLSVSQDDRGGTVWSVTHGDARDSLRVPPQRIANAKRAVSVRQILDDMVGVVPKGEPEAVCEVTEETAKALLPKSVRNTLVEFVERFYRFKDKEKDGVVRNQGLPEGIRALLEAPVSGNGRNCRTLGDGVTHCRVQFSQLEQAAGLKQPLIVEVAPQTVEEARSQASTIRGMGASIAAVALPMVVYEGQLSAVSALLSCLKGLSVAVEVNSWDTWELARHTGLEMMGGAGLAVLNALAARKLWELGCASVTISPEIDKEQLEALCQAAEVPLALTVYGRPKLMMTRAALPQGFRPQDGGTFRDARNTQLMAERNGAVTDLRSAVAVDWRQLKNPAVRVALVIADYSGFSGPFPPKNGGEASLFNYDRRLR